MQSYNNRIETLRIFWLITQNIYLCSLELNDGVVAQSVEQRTENPCVAGSIPADTTALAIWGSLMSLFIFLFFV